MKTSSLVKNSKKLLELNHNLASIKDDGKGRTQRGGGGVAAGAVASQRKLNLQFLFYFKYIGQDKSCLIFKYIGTLSSFAPLAKKSCVRPCDGRKTRTDKSLENSVFVALYSDMNPPYMLTKQ